MSVCQVPGYLCVSLVPIQLGLSLSVCMVPVQQGVCLVSGTLVSVFIFGVCLFGACSSCLPNVKLYKISWEVQEMFSRRKKKML